MKTNFTRIYFITGLLFLTSFFLPVESIAQPDYDFRNPVLLSGTDKQIGAVYLFSNVKTGVDARVTITDISPGMTVVDLDAGSGYPEALQPTITANSHINGYLEMYFEFLIAGTSTPLIQTEVPVTCIDVDGTMNMDGSGNPLHEFDEVNLGGGYVDYQLTGGELSVVQVGNWFNGKNVAGLEYPGRDTTARQVMYTTVNGNISFCTIRVGVDNQSNINVSRLRSVYFKKFIYPNSILSKSSLLSFQGLEKNNTIELKWKIENQNNLKTVIIERGNVAAGFTSIGKVNMNEKNNEQLDFSFKDNTSFEGSVYYRLKMISFNGTVKYSNMLVFHSGNAVKDFKIYPSVVQTSATVQVKSETTTTAIFQLVDYSGRVIIQKNVTVQEGTNNIVVGNLGSIHPGNYVALVRVNNKVYNQKIFKQ